MICHGFWKTVIALICLIVITIAVQAEDQNKTYEIICEDGEHFLIHKKDAVEANNPIQPTDDYVVIDMQKLQLTYFRDGKMVKNYPVAIGEPETPSPIGEWKIIHKGGNWGNGFGARWIGLNVPWGIYGIHGTNKPWSIGSRSSHGCIRMFNQHVLELYSLVKLGTPVYITGQLPKVSPRKEVIRHNTGRDIVAFQFALRKAGFEPGIADGRFGLDMELAVLKLQFYYGLTPNGKVSFNEHIILGITDVFMK